MERQDPAASPRGGIGAIGDGDGPLRDTFTNRDINTKRSFIFFYASLSRPRPRRRPRILTRPSWRPPVKILVALLHSSPPSHPCSRSRTLLRVHARVSAHDLRRGAAACSAAENFMTTSCSLYIRGPSNTRHPRIDHVFGRYIYARERLHIPPSSENIERGGQSGLRATAC